MHSARSSGSLPPNIRPISILVKSGVTTGLLQWRPIDGQCSAQLGPLQCGHAFQPTLTFATTQVARLRAPHRISASSRCTILPASTGPGTLGRATPRSGHVVHFGRKLLVDHITNVIGHNTCERLFQGIRDIPGTDTCLFTTLKNIPHDRKITYGKIVCDYKPHKKEKKGVRLTISGERPNYSGDVATSMADITSSKILINSTLSTKYTAMMMMDIKNYYLGTRLPRFKYMKMLLSRFPEEIIQKYNLNDMAVDGWVYIEIRKGMYGLKQAGLLSNQLLQTRLAPFGCYPARHTPGLWLHKARPISFNLVVNDFTVKCVGKQHAEYLGTAFCELMNSQLTGPRRSTPA
jgi:hypothetical protein